MEKKKYKKKTKSSCRPNREYITKIICIKNANKGKFNRFGVAGLPISDRNRSGGKVIKLAKGDYIHNIFGCNSNYVLRIIRADEVLDINVSDIPIGSSISAGTKMCKDGVLKVELIKKE